MKNTRRPNSFNDINRKPTYSSIFYHEVSYHPPKTKVNASPSITPDSTTLLIRENHRVEMKQKSHSDDTTLCPDNNNNNHSCDELPNEIISRILQQVYDQQDSLCECAAVSKQFYAIVKPLLWRSVNLGSQSKSIQFLACLHNQKKQQRKQQTTTPFGHYIHDIRLAYSFWTDDRLLHLLPQIPNLKRFSLGDRTHISDTSIRHLPRHCKQLCSLRILYTPLTHISMTAVSRYCTQLVDFEWRLPRLQSAEPLEMLTLNGCSLKRLYISVQTPLNDKVIMMIQILDLLTSLTIMDSTSTDMNDLLLPLSSTTTTFGTITPPLPVFWPNLTILKLTPCDELYDTTIISFIHSHPYLKALHLFDATILTRDFLKALTTSVPNQLTHMTLTGNAYITSNDIRQFLLPHQSRLKELNLQWCHHILVEDFPEVKESMNNVVILHRSALDKLRQVTME